MSFDVPLRARTLCLVGPVVVSLVLLPLRVIDPPFTSSDLPCPSRTLFLSLVFDILIVVMLSEQRLLDAENARQRATMNSIVKSVDTLQSYC